MPSERFKVELTRKAQKDLDDLRGLGDRVVEKLLTLEKNPAGGHQLVGTLRNSRSLEFSLPGGAFRAAYIILDLERVCLVYMIGPHENFYREATRRMEALRRGGTI